MGYINETAIVPKSTNKFLRTYGGVNPFGEAIWRLVMAADVYSKRYGNYRDWDKNLSVAERGGMDFSADPDRLEAVNAELAGMQVDLGSAPPINVVHHRNKPVREVTEIREVQLYPNIHGWILERWFPAESQMIGSREQWESFKAADGKTPFLGEYPAQGDWVMLFGPYAYLPTEDQMKLWISKYYHGQEEFASGSAEQRMIAAAYEFEQAEDKKWKANRTEYNAMMSDRWKTIAQSGSLGMSRLRQELAKRAGITEHIGIL